MSNPKFSVGQRVAVCTAELDIVIPQTVVVWVKYFYSYVIIQNGKIVRCQPGWGYRVHGFPGFLAERCLRPIDDDEYREDSTEMDSEVSAEGAK
jgi:hypothetical protein